MPGITPKLPLSLSTTDGYTLIQTLPKLVQQNLKHLLLTHQGERMMDPNFGVGIRRYLFEQNIDTTHKQLKTEINKQVNKYMPFLTIQDIIINQDADDGNIMYVTIHYIIAPLNQADSTTVEARR